ncbi:related to RAV1-Regulator of (H+)-ATPase in vacuolar membrane [Sporisorium reilianum f. sp. reilianum]|uniref:Related to RAV1-Regulator of (H+)-ATPase in vacuolar membrane n=1 Tax=Sporisorium reilianum f. sp. reilianum TaxID=72559 RepID=A0A2N8U810_9BASI|nr:related to RAV1-Regulator of (H+)-ATPase in vacuolar membrane [Sporisorium reilianum f. sp. reilianum]
MSSTQPLASCSRPSQVVLGTIDHHDPHTESSRHAAIRHPRQYDSVVYLAGRDPRDGLTVQASFDQVCVLSRDQRFDQALPFWDAFSGSQNTDRCISCTAIGLSAERDHIYIAAAMDHRIAVWYAPVSSSSPSRKWRVHSTLTVNEGVVTTLDFVNGQLLAGSTTSLALWRLDNSDVPIWKRFWTKPTPAAIAVARFSPDATTIAAVAQGGQHVLLWQYQPRSTKAPVYQQRLYHARPVTGLVWRQPPEQNSQADVLISYASDGVGRIWAPVIDEPTQLRLWCSVQAPPSAHAFDVPSAFYLDAHTVCAALRTNIGILQREIQMAELGVGSSNELTTHDLELDMDLKRTRLRRLEQLLNETPDMFVSFGKNGFVSVTAVANIDRRPPTLLQALTVLRFPFALPRNADNIIAVRALPLYIAPDASSTATMLVLHVQFGDGVSTAYAVNPASFFDGRGSGIEADTCHPCGPPPSSNLSARRLRRHTGRVESLQRSADGNALMSCSAKESIAWTSDASLTHPEGRLHCQSSMRSASLAATSRDGSISVLMSSDRAGEVYRASDDTSAGFDCEAEVKHVALASFSDSDLLIAVSTTGAVHSWALQETADGLHLVPNETSSLWLDRSSDRRLVSADSSSGPSNQLDNDLSLVIADNSGRIEVRHATRDLSGELRWPVTATFDESTGTTRLARRSANGLVAVVTRDEQGKDTLVVFDSKTTSFNSGEEHRQTFGSDESIVAIDWSPSPLSSSVLAVAFEHHVDIIAPGRSSPNDARDAGPGPQWQLLVRLDLRTCTPSSIRAACWLGSEQLVIASGSVLFVYGPWLHSGLQDVTRSRKMHLAELVTEVGGPVVQYHPTFLLQCAVWHKLGLAKAIITNLNKAVLACSSQDVGETWAFEDVPLDAVLEGDSTADNAVSKQAAPLPRKSFRGSILDEPDRTDEADEADLFASDRIDDLACRLKEIHPPHLSSSDLGMLVNLIKTIGEAVREHRSLDPSGLRYTLALRQTLNGTSESKEVKVAPHAGLGYRDFLWAFHSNNQETLLAAIESAYRNKLDWPAARATGLFVWLQNPSALRAQAEAVARAQFMSGEDRDPVKCSLLYFALGKRKVVQGLWRQAVWHPEQKKMLQFLSHDFDEERWKTAAQKNAFALLSQRRYEFAASFFMLGESLRDAINVCVRNLDDLPLAIALARIQEGRDDGPVFTELLKNRVLPLAFERGDRWMGSWAFWMLKRRDLAVRIIVTPLRDLVADADVASLLGAPVTCGNDSYSDPALALLFQHLRTKSLQTIKGLYGIPEKKVFDFVLTTNRALCRMGCDAIGLSLLRNWQFEPPAVSSASTQFHRVSKHDLATLSRVDEAVVESTDAFSALRVAEASTHDAQGEAGPKGSASQRRRTSQGTISPPSSPRMLRRRSSLLRRRSSIINDLDIGAAVSARPDAPDAVSEARPEVLTAEPASLGTVNGHAKESSGTKADDAPEPKKQGISVFKSAAASNSQQGAQEFDFGSFGF